MFPEQSLEVERYHLRPGYIFICPDPVIISAVIGSCVAVCLHDRKLKIGGMSHFLYPSTKWIERKKPTPKYGNISISALIKLIIKEGSQLSDLEAQVFGGGSLNLTNKNEIAQKNIKIAKKILKKNNIPIILEDVGGQQGRRLIFHTSTNESIVMHTHRIRKGDFYPYRNRLEQ